MPKSSYEGIGKYKKSDDRRKPNPGMIFEAAKDYNIDLSNSIMLGDNISDMEAGFLSGIKNYFIIKRRKI